MRPTGPGCWPCWMAMTDDRGTVYGHRAARASSLQAPRARAAGHPRTRDDRRQCRQRRRRDLDLRQRRFPIWLVSEFAGVGAAMELFGVSRFISVSIPPYMQFYDASAVVDKHITPANYPSERIDSVSGSIWSNIVSIFIIIATAAAIGGSGPLQAPQRAAEALRPAVGPAAPALFAVGLLGASLLAASVVPLSTSYAIADAVGAPRSVSAKLGQGPLFYGIFTLQVVVGAAVALAPGNLVALVVNAQVLNGVITPLLLTYVLILANRR